MLAVAFFDNADKPSYSGISTTVSFNSNYEIKPNSEVVVFVLGVICIIKQRFARCSQSLTQAMLAGFVVGTTKNLIVF
ncbi:hypothetical protein SD80_004820 [Scytonema tolypothrichoides VB-61278]|nr:hypothetical protein SD80_004820 [Scytonema tolypothrichoides VB-61278]